MTESRKFRYVGPQAATFVAVTLLLGGVGVFLAGRAQGWFEETLHLKTTLHELPNDSALNLSRGSEVRIFGNKVGSVVEVTFKEVKPNGAVELDIEMVVRGEPFMAFVRKGGPGPDSRVLIKESLTGSAFVQITAGRGREVADGEYLESEFMPGIVQRADRLLAELGQEKPVPKLNAILENLEAGTERLASLAAKLDRGEGDLGRLLNRADITEQLVQMLRLMNASLTQVQGTLAGVLSDLSVMTKTMRGEVESLKGFIGEARQTVAAANKALGQVNAMTGALLKQIENLPKELLEQAEDLPATLLQIQELMRQTTRLVEGLQRTWLLRSHMEPETIRRLSPAEVATPR